MGLVVWEGDDNELRVGDDGRPFFLPDALEKNSGDMKVEDIKSYAYFHKNHMHTHVHIMYVKSYGAQ